MSSTVPGAIAALLAALGAAEDVPDQVIDGPPTVDLEPESVMIGYNGDVSAAGVEVTDSEAGLVADKETYDISCLVNVWSGDTDDTATKRSRVYQILDAIDGVLSADRSLGGAVMTARLSTGDLAQQQIREGLAVACRFTVSCVGFRR